MENNHYPFVNLPLPYAYDALEPFIDEKTMHLHHDRHLQTYIQNLNQVLLPHPELQKLSLEQLIRYSCRLPEGLREKVRNNAGGVYNHRFYFNGLAIPAQPEPYGRLRLAIERRFQSYEQFRDAFQKAALSVFGSGYAWLGSKNGDLSIVTSANQDSPVACGLRPVLTVDVWEHAYYLKHYNGRAGYLEDWFRVINWEQAEQIFRRGG